MKKYKKCPRCDKRTFINEEKCPNCGLIYSRLKKASNSAAKRYLKNKKYKKVIMSKTLPSDVNKWHLFLWAVFLGIFGIHFLKVGRVKTFLYMLFSSLVLILAVICLPITDWLYEENLFLITLICVLPASISAMLWIGSVFQILFNSFKVPIAIDEDIVKRSLDPNIVKDILTTVGKDKEPKTELKTAKPNELKSKKTQKREKIRVVCASCGTYVKVDKDETICPKCDEPLKDD